jgi:hypothetical protein
MLETCGYDFGINYPSTAYPPWEEVSALSTMSIMSTMSSQEWDPQERTCHWFSRPEPGLGFMPSPGPGTGNAIPWMAAGAGLFLGLGAAWLFLPSGDPWYANIPACRLSTRVFNLATLTTTTWPGAPRREFSDQLDILGKVGLTDVSSNVCCLPFCAKFWLPRFTSRVALDAAEKYSTVQSEIVFDLTPLKLPEKPSVSQSSVRIHGCLSSSAKSRSSSSTERPLQAFRTPWSPHHLHMQCTPSTSETLVLEVHAFMTRADLIWSCQRRPVPPETRCPKATCRQALTYNHAFRSCNPLPNTQQDDTFAG